MWYHGQRDVLMMRQRPTRNDVFTERLTNTNSGFGLRNSESGCVNIVFFPLAFYFEKQTPSGLHGAVLKYALLTGFFTDNSATFLCVRQRLHIYYLKANMNEHVSCKYIFIRMQFPRLNIALARLLIKSLGVDY